MPKAKIFVVDDEPTIVDVCGRILEHAGFEVQHTTKGQQALKQLLHQPFDLALVDILMPDISGLEILQQVSQQVPDLAVIVITGHGTLETALGALRLGAEGFVLKPFEEQELLATVQEVLSRRAIQREHQRLRSRLPLLQLGQALVSNLDAPTLVQRAMQIIAQEIDASSAALFIRDHPDTWQLQSSIGDPPSFAADPDRLQAVMTQVEQIQDPHFLHADRLVSADQTSDPDTTLILPIDVQHHIAGVLTISGSPTLPTLGPGDLEFVKILARQVIITLENSRLFSAVNQSRREWEETFTAITDAISVHDLSLRIVHANPSLQSMLGTSAAELIGQHGERVFVDWYETQSPSPLRSALERNLAQSWEVTEPGGRTGQFQVSVYPISNGSGQASGVVQVIQDITEQKQVQAKLLQTEKLAALGRMVASLAHEINNPLQALDSGLSLLLNPTLPEGKRQQYLKLASAEVQRLIAIVQRMLNFYRPSSNIRTKTDINLLINEVLALAGKTLQHQRIQVITKLQADLPTLNLVPDQIKQVFVNILLNAVDAMPDGGKPHISTVIVEHELQIKFQDSGTGIPSKTFEQIFEPFYTSKEQGTGLGLSISLNILEQHGGHIEADSTPGQGSTFTVCLPLEG